jgi:N4-gp56 family major capsid protein
MALSNFAKLTQNQLTVWGRDVWKAARNTSFVMRNFVGDGPNAVIQRITELTETTKGTRAVFTLVPDLEGDGVVGDNQLEGNEEEIKAYDQVIRYDQMRNANRLEGRMADLKSAVRFRSTSKDLLANWLAQRIDEIAFLVMSGVSLQYRTNGALRVGSQLPMLEFAADITAPTANRQFRWDLTGGLVAAGTNNLLPEDKLTWDTLLQMRAKAVDAFIRPVSTDDGIDVYTVFVSTGGMQSLKQDQKFLDAMKYARERGQSNPLFKGTGMGGTGSGIYVDGLNVVEYRNVFTTRGAPSGSKWGDGTVDGSRALLVGAQALAVADIGVPKWVEKDFDYDNSPGVSIAKLIGFKKPVWRSAITGTMEDFSIIAVDHAI